MQKHYSCCHAARHIDLLPCYPSCASPVWTVFSGSGVRSMYALLVRNLARLLLYTPSLVCCFAIFTCCGWCCARIHLRGITAAASLPAHARRCAAATLKKGTRFCGMCTWAALALTFM
jgi:hypothetical protein